MSLDLCAALTDAGVFADIDRYFAASMVELGADANVALSAATVSAMHRAGHTCLPLSAAGRPVVEVVDGLFAGVGADLSAAVRRIRLPTLPEWQETLAASPVVMNGAVDGPTLPLVLDANRLYLHRLFDAERRLAERLLALAARPAPHRLDGALRRVFSGNPEPEAVAAARAAMGQLCIVTGGPGTGKTTLAASLIALLADLGLAKPDRIGLATPTGKAAARLQEAVKTQLDAGDLRSRVPALADYEPSASTVHRLLTRPLRLDALIVDECSMVDLSLMTRLIDALPDACRLILLGDADQLSSVEPGSVFSDLCNVGGGSPLTPCVVRLTRSHRFDPSKGIGRLADAVVHGDVDRALATLRDDGDERTELRRLPDEQAFDQFANECAGQWATHIETLRAETADARPFPNRRVLCAHRRGPYGVNRFNRLVERRLHELGIVDEEEFYIGRPIIVTRNDRRTGLSNGDTGVVVAHDGERRVWFPELGGDERLLLSPSRLAEHESFFALTVHRAQGSEYDELAFIPGDAESRVSSRELFYTAVTRARSKVAVLAEEQAVVAALQRGTTRATGLATRLAANRR